MQCRLVTCCLAAALAVLLAGPSLAEVSIEPASPSEPTRIAIVGTVDWAAADLFIQTADGASSATVNLNSEGGDLLAALIIGRTIREKKFTTSVKRGAQCTSVCGL